MALGVQFHTAQIDDPHECGGIVDDEFFSRSARWKGSRGCVQPRGEVGGSTLLIKRGRLSSVDETLQHKGTIEASESAGSNGKAISHHIQPGKPDLSGEVELIRACDADLMTVQRERISAASDFPIRFHSLLHTNRFDAVRDFGAREELSGLVPERNAVAVRVKLGAG